MRQALAIDALGERFAWMTPGEPTIALYDGAGDYLGSLTYLAPGFVRSELLDGDTPLANKVSLEGWLRVRGWEPSQYP